MDDAELRQHLVAFGNLLMSIDSRLNRQEAQLRALTTVLSDAVDDTLESTEASDEQADDVPLPPPEPRRGPSVKRRES